jgi:hypothetical protein
VGCVHHRAAGRRVRLILGHGDGPTRYQLKWGRRLSQPDLCASGAVAALARQCLPSR